MRAIIVGCGVSGLTTAILFQEAGWRTTIWTAAMPEDTVSSVAAAQWYPFRAYPQDKVLRWGELAYRVFAGLADDPRSGVYLRAGIELWRMPVPDPWWAVAVPGFGRCTAADLRPGYVDGYRFTVPIVEMPIYLQYLLARFVAAGGRVEMRTLDGLDEASGAADVVVNCSGLGAYSLVGDSSMAPIRGQIVRVRNPGLTEFILDEEPPEDVTYILPRTTDCILGGTTDAGIWDMSPDPDVAAAIVRRCVALEPRLANAEVLEHKVGLRPGRPTIRLEREDGTGGAPIIHNYGHGGAGVTLSWGCAEEALALA
jgi:D-amino-acid oxidase